MNTAEFNTLVVMRLTMRKGGLTRAGRVVVSDKMQTEGEMKRINLNWPFMMIKQSNSLVHSQLYAIESKDA